MAASGEDIQGGAPGTSVLVERLTTLVGLLTGAAALIYTTGATVYTAALSSRDVPSALSIATGLPRELLIGSGLLFVALPVALAALVLSLLTAVLRWVGKEWPDRKCWRKRIAAAVVFVGCVGLAIAVRPCSWLAVAGVLVATAGTVVAFTYLGLTLTDSSPSPQGSRDRRRRLSYLIGIGVLLMTGWGLWIGIARTSLPDALLCTKSGGEHPGFLIAETGSRVYVGEDPEAGRESEAERAHTDLSNAERRVISVPSGEVAELFIGSAAGSCLLSRTEDQVAVP